MTREKLQPVVGQIYLRGTYHAGFEDRDRRVVVTAVKPDEKGWYDDHQEGGWESKGLVEYRFVDAEANEVYGLGWDALEYFQDTFEAVDA